MITHSPCPTRAGFTRADLAMVLGACALLLLTGASLLGKTQAASHRATCANNLRQIGVAILKFATDHNNTAPWYVRPEQGGTYPQQSVYQHMLFLSNYVDSPRIAACPGDPDKAPAVDFTGGPQGLMGLGARAVSYAIQTEIGMSFPMSLLMSDGMIGGGEPGLYTCNGAGYANAPGSSYYVVKKFRADPYYSSSLWPYWLPKLHDMGMGNVLFADGRVETCDSDGLVAAYRRNPPDDNKSGCTLMP